MLEHKLLFEAIANSSLDEPVRRKYLNAIVYSYYRSAYTVIAELYKIDYCRVRRLEDIKIICQSYNHTIKCKTGNLKNILLSVPIRLCLCKTIDYIMNKSWIRK